VFGGAGTVLKRGFSLFAALVFSGPVTAKPASDGPAEPLDVGARLARANAIFEQLDQPVDYGGVTRDKEDPNKVAWFNFRNFANFSNFRNFANFHNFSNFRNFQNFHNFTNFSNFHNAPVSVSPPVVAPSHVAPSLPSYTPPTHVAPSLPSYTPPTHVAPSLPTFTPPTHVAPVVPTFTPPTHVAPAVPAFSPPTRVAPVVPTVAPPLHVSPSLPPIGQPTPSAPNLPGTTVSSVTPSHLGPASGIHSGNPFVPVHGNPFPQGSIGPEHRKGPGTGQGSPGSSTGTQHPGGGTHPPSRLPPPTQAQAHAPVGAHVRWALVQERVLNLFDEGLPLDEIEALLDPDLLQDADAGDYLDYLACTPDQNSADCINAGIAQVVLYQAQVPQMATPEEQPPAPMENGSTGEPAPVVTASAVPPEQQPAGPDSPTPGTAAPAEAVQPQPSSAPVEARAPDCDQVAEAYVAKNFDVLASGLPAQRSVPDECQPTVQALQSKSLGSDWDEIKKLSDYLQDKQLPPGPIGDGTQ